MAVNIWEWNQGYCEPWSSNRIVPANFNGNLNLTTFFPPGYKVSDGVTVGGVYPTTQTPSNYPIVLWPEQNGTGPYKFETHADFVVQNNSTGTAFFAASFGVAYVSGPDPSSQPMWPWLGVGHLADGISNLPLVSLQPRETKAFSIGRLDILDGALFVGPGGAPPLWPAWASQPAASTLMYPGICFSFRTTTEAVTVGEINAWGKMISL